MNQSINTPNFTYQVHFAWWVIYVYLPCLSLMVNLCRLYNPSIEPNWDRVWHWVQHGTTIRCNGQRVRIGR